jgi:hypothetical protein
MVRVLTNERRLKIGRRASGVWRDMRSAAWQKGCTCDGRPTGVAETLQHRPLDQFDNHAERVVPTDRLRERGAGWQRAAYHRIPFAPPFCIFESILPQKIPTTLRFKHEETTVTAAWGITDCPWLVNYSFQGGN